MNNQTPPVRRQYTLIYDSGAGIKVWDTTAEALLSPNGTEPLIAYMLRESEARGATVFSLELQ